MSMPEQPPAATEESSCCAAPLKQRSLRPWLIGGALLGVPLLLYGGWDTGNAMQFNGLPDEGARADLIAFLKAASEGKAARVPKPPGSLPFQWAITSKRGTGRRKISILSDPNCPYCKRFEEDLAKLDDITVHIFPYAVISPQSVRQAKSVWCSKDRVRAWNDLMFRRIEPQAGTGCDNPIEKLIEYGGRLGATSTPTWFLENGERYSGAMKMQELVPRLEAASKKR